MIHLLSISRTASFPAEGSGFPYDVPAIRTLPTLTFSTPVTFFVGENGSGKSTLLEAIAGGANAITVGSTDMASDATLAKVRRLSKYLRLAWAKRTHRGFFMRSEDFFGFAKRITEIQTELEADLAAIDRDYAGRSERAKGLARMPYARELHELRERYGDGLDARSHGEAFLSLFQSRFVPNGLYLLDEPEAPLSPLRQIGFLSLLKEMVENHDAQFLIATHSPILMSYPGATILAFDSGTLQQVDWADLEHVSTTRAFLNDPEAFLKHL